MKSIFLTILIFAGVFLLIKSEALFVITQNWFHYLSYGSFVAVMLCGVYFTIFYKKDDTTTESSEKELEHDKEE